MRIEEITKLLQEWQQEDPENRGVFLVFGDDKTERDGGMVGGNSRAISRSLMGSILENEYMGDVIFAALTGITKMSQDMAKKMKAMKNGRVVS